MAAVPHDPACTCSSTHEHGADRAATDAARLTRRGLLTAAAALGAGAVGLGNVVRAQSEVRADRLVEPGTALLPAVRVPPPEPPPFVPPEEGEILFPIVVQEGDRCGVLDNFGDTRGRPPPYYHMACDIMADEGLPLRAVVDGQLTYRYENTFFGWTLYDPVTDVVYKYFHNTADANGFREGDFVEQGDIIGYVGDTGTSPGNFHLHFEYRPGNVPADPYHLFQRAEFVQFW